MAISVSNPGGASALRCAQWTSSGAPISPRVEQPLELGVAGVVATHEPHLHEPATGLRLGLDDAAAGLGRHRQRLLAQHRLARVQAREDEVVMAVDGGGDQHGVDVVGGDDLVTVGVDAGAAGRARHRRRALRVDVRHRGHPRAADAGGDRADVRAAHHPGADDAHPDVAHVAALVRQGVFSGC
jgi:hypothetical protein